MGKNDVIIVGAGLAGLSCAKSLHEHDYNVLVLEASDHAGGRIRSDHYQGFILDRGFQVLQTAYPAAHSVLDLEALDLRRFYPGALTRFNGRFHRVVDPWQFPRHALHALFSSVGTVTDKLRVALLRHRIRLRSWEDIYHLPETTTLKALHDLGFSDPMIERFFRPFLAGVFFDHKLEISNRAFMFVFRTFAFGDSTLPARGMGTITDQLAACLPNNTIRTNAKVQAIEQQGVILESGEHIAARIVVIATESWETPRLLKNKLIPGYRSTTCLYFSAVRPPITEPILILNGETSGPINSIIFPTNLSSAYAPIGKALITVNVLGNPKQDDKALETAVRSQLQEWFGEIVQNWEHLRTYRIVHALPMQVPPVNYPPFQQQQIKPWLFVCGEYDSSASIQWALDSGARVAEKIRSTSSE